jgi:hypothetical protein
LPDAVIVDIDITPVTFWLVEVVATDGPVDEERRQKLRGWAAANSINPDHCRFLTAFASRSSAPARRRLKDLAAGRLRGLRMSRSENWPGTSFRGDGFPRSRTSASSGRAVRTIGARGAAASG